ncbi:hypothetical protein E2562_008968 [Oryza meyeriana var. granulata]|uniref:Uncharacterized protein n=1 Tax=Oryza meyeriana var. granulata TaxID=110450 RepID=A0A6G1CZ87_9ORYZ|nr:hypothetical protein E2562_008968 [Oryza meyeriana var. granulata]
MSTKREKAQSARFLLTAFFPRLSPAPPISSSTIPPIGLGGDLTADANSLRIPCPPSGNRAAASWFARQRLRGIPLLHAAAACGLTDGASGPRNHRRGTQGVSVSAVRLTFGWRMGDDRVDWGRARLKITLTLGLRLLLAPLSSNVVIRTASFDAN